MLLLLTMFAAQAADGPVRSHDEQAELLTETSIARLEELLRTSLPDETRAELLLRLAELTASQARRMRLREMESAGAPSPAGSMARQERAITLYRAVLRQFPRYARADEAALALGYVLEELGRSAEADEALKLLVRTYPESDALPDAWLLLGEHAFDAGNVHGALKAYQRAAAPRHPKAAYALYKLAWCEYNVGELEAAVRTLQRVVVAGLAVPPEDTVTLRMDHEALADLPRFFADAGLVEEGERWFASIGRPELARRAEVLFADLLRERGDWDGAARSLRRLLLDGPDLELHAALVRVLEQAGRSEDALAEVDRLLTQHGPTEEADALLRKLALGWHLAARKHGKRSAEAASHLALAEGAYRRWLAAFADREHAAELRYGYGELLYALGRWREAHDQYVAVVELGGPRAVLSAESAVFAAEKLVGVVERPVATDAVGGPEPLTEDDRRLLEACARYAALDPGVRVADVLYEAGYLLYHRRHFDEAAERFRAVIAIDPRSQEAEYAAHLILDALAVQESWSALAETALAFAGEQHLGTAAFRAEVGAIAVNASFREVEAGYERDRDAARAGEGFERFASAFPDQPLAMQALHDAAVRYGEAGRFADELRVRARLVDDPRWGPRSPWYAEDLRELGFGLEQIADFAGAADRYEALWALPDRGEEAAALDAIWSAAVFRHALGDTERAALDYAAFAQVAAEDPRRFDARLRAGRIREDTSGLVALWEDLTAPAEVRLEAAFSAGETMRPADRDRLYGRAVLAEGDRSIVARMRAVLAEPAVGAYRAIGISGTEDRALRRAIGHKVRAFRLAEAALQAVIDTGDGAQGLAALVTMGELYRDLAQALEASPTPAHLTPEQATMYRRGVHDQAWSLDEKAVDAFALAVERSAELALYGAATARAVRALGLLRPEDFGGMPEELPPVGVVATATVPRAGFETALDQAGALDPTRARRAR